MRGISVGYRKNETDGASLTPRATLVGPSVG